MRFQGKRILLVLTSLLVMSTLSFAEKYSINGIFTIEVGDDFELKNNPSVQKTTIGELTVLRGDRIVFQQYGLNANFHWALDTYARIIIVTGSGEEEGTFPACNQDIELTESDRSELLASAREDARPWRITRGPTLSNAEVNGHPCLKLFYEREGDHGGARATSYWFFNDTQFARILTSYAIPDEGTYKQPLTEVVESFSWNNPRFATGASAMSDEDRERVGNAILKGIEGLIVLCIILGFAISGIVKSVKRKKHKNEPVAKTGNVLKEIVKQEEAKLPPPLPKTVKKEEATPPMPPKQEEAKATEAEKVVPAMDKVKDEVKDSPKRVNYSLSSSKTLQEYLFYYSPEKGTIIYPHRHHKGKIRGYSEEMFESLLRSAFANLPLGVYGDVNLKLSETAKSYEPDIALISSTSSNIRIDIEIDEPYSLVSRNPIHYAEDNSDAVRDLIMKSAGWIVMRFAEEQIVKQPMACVSSIARLLIQIDSSLVPESCSISEFVKPVTRWTKAEAELMAQNNYREEYLEISSPVSPQNPGEEDDRPLTEEEKAARIEIKTVGLWGETEKKSSIKFNAENISDRDARIEFFPDTHTYILDGIINLLPATTVISNHFPAFDGARIAERMVRNGNPKSVQELLDEFAYKGAIAREVGTFMHEQIENKFLGKEVSAQYRFQFSSKTRNEDEYVRIDKELSQFDSFVNSRSIEPYRTEWRIFDEKYGIAGTIDLLAKSGDKYVMYDWKRSLKVISPSTGGMYSIQGNGFASGFGKLSHLDNSSFNHYCLQQNLYRRILGTRYGIDVSQMFLVIFHRDYDRYYLIPVPKMDKEINVILDEMDI